MSRIILMLITFSVVFITACGKEIGDSCSTSQNCPAGAVCDTTQPGGYCTITPCWPGGCPDEAVCVDFGHQNTFCMKRCIDDYDCREEYSCVKDREGHSFCMYRGD